MNDAIRTAAEVDIKRRVQRLNEAIATYRDDGLVFVLVADPAFPLALQTPVRTSA